MSGHRLLTSKRLWPSTHKIATSYLFSYFLLAVLHSSPGLQSLSQYLLALAIIRQRWMGRLEQLIHHSLNKDQNYAIIGFNPVHNQRHTITISWRITSIPSLRDVLTNLLSLVESFSSLVALQPSFRLSLYLSCWVVYLTLLSSYASLSTRHSHS